MRLQTVIWFVILLTCLLLTAVHAEVERLQSGYRLGELVLREAELRAELDRGEAALARLSAPERLERLNRDLDLGLRPRPSASTGRARAEGR
jgi:hypothetical protein